MKFNDFVIDFSPGEDLQPPLVNHHRRWIHLQNDVARVKTLFTKSKKKKFEIKTALLLTHSIFKINSPTVSR